MAFKKGEPRPANAGRKKGSANVATAARARAVEESGLTPLEFMVDVMRNEAYPIDFRLDAAKAASPYIHPKLSSIEMKGDPNAPVEVHHTIDAFTGRITRLAARNAEDAGNSDAE